MDEQDGGRAVRGRRRRVVAIGAGAAALALGAALLLVPSSPADPGTAAPGTSAPSASERAPASSAASPAASSAVRAAQASAAEASAAAAAAQQAAQPDLDAVVATLGGPVVLTSPTAWDQWLPDGKPYPGASTEEDIATCPRLADRLTAAFGMRMSYWTGTLPNGPRGCSWVPVPLSYDGPYDYGYLVDVGFLGDGTTVDDLRRQFFDRVPEDPTPCPLAEVPGPGAGGVLIRCGGMDDRYDAQFVLAVPDARGAGVWVLAASAQLDEAHPSSYALTTLVDAVTRAYG
jgi:hypothetical protein